MVQIDLKIPTLVTHVSIKNQPHFKLRPLFLLNPSITHRRYQNAITLFKKEIRQYFKYYHLNRTNAAGLFWFSFRPELVFFQHAVDFRMGQHQIKGNLSCIRFKVNDLLVVCLPAIKNLMFIEGSAEEFAEPNLIQLDRFVKHHLKKEKESLGEAFDPDQYFSTKKDFLTEVNLKMELKFDAIEYGKPEEDNFFARAFSNPEFHGQTEIQRVGIDLNEHFPQELKRAYFREREIEQLFPMIYQSQNTPIAIIGREGVGRHTLIQETLYRYLAQNQEKMIND